MQMAASTASARASASTEAQDNLSLFRLHVLRAIYLFIGLGEGSQILPILINHQPTDRGVIASLLGGMCLLDLLGLKYPRQMLPLLLFEFAWKAIWMLAFGLPQYFSGQQPPTFAEDFFNIMVGVVLMPIVIPWGHLWRHYVKAPGDRWR
jgi:hypothetical protein